MKKISMFLCFTMLFVTIFTTNVMAEEISPYNYLLGIGVPSSYLESISGEDINSIYNDLKGKNCSFNSLETSNEYDTVGGVITRGYIPSKDLNLSIMTVQEMVNNTNIIKNVNVYVSWTWASNKPMIRHEDAISINWDNSLFQFKSNSFKSKDYMDGKSKPYNTITVPAIVNQGGLGYHTLLANSSTEFPDLHGFTSFILTCNDTIREGDTRSTSINANYAHDKNPIPGIGITFSKSGFGVSIDTGYLTDTISATTNLSYE